MTIVTKNSLTLSNVNDGTITHYAYAYSADGTDRFTTTYPNLNLLDGTKDFSGTWTNSSSWVTDGTYKGLTVKKRTAQWNGIYKNFTAPKDGTYTFSAYVKASGSAVSVYRYGGVNSTSSQALIQKRIGDTFDWTRDSITLSLKANDNVWVRYEITANGTDSILWVAGYKYEPGSVSTPHIPSSSEVTTADWPSYIGQYTDFSSTASTDPAKYAPWIIFKGTDGTDGVNGKDGIAGKDGVGINTTVITYAISTSGTTAPTSGWTTQVPALIKGQYLWTKTVWTYTDNTNGTGYSVTYISKDGNNGTDGIAGKDGNGIKTTTITYVGSTSGTTVPTSGWTTTVPTVAAGSYLWTKTVWGYTDNTSETGYSVAKMGNTGPTGPAGAPGSNGDPGKVVSDTEPTTRFKGLTWKYSGTTDLTASDGTVIHPNTEYYYNGTHWMINYLSANNLEANSITADLIDAKNLTITDGEFSSTIIDGPVQIQTEIKDDHLLIYKMDTSHNEIHTIALKSDSGLGMTYQNSDTGEYTSAGVNFQGLFMQNNITNEFARLTPQGTKLSTDVPWTILSPLGGFSGGLIRFAVKNGVAHFSLAGLSCPSMTAGNWIKCAQLPTGSIAIPSENQVTAAFTNATVWGFYVSKSGGLYLQSTSNSPALNGLVNASNSFPIG